jgi:hypothetical protein
MFNLLLSTSLYFNLGLVLLVIWAVKAGYAIFDWTAIWEKIFENIVFSVFLKAAVYLTLLVGTYLQVVPHSMT